MQTKHNFGAGPCILPPSVMDQASRAVLNWNDSGLSILEVSHRSPEFEAVIQKTQQLVRDLLDVPSDYSILFLQGGASTQFSMIPLNFLHGNQKAAYLDSGFFAQKAMKEAKFFGEVILAGACEKDNYTYIPALEQVEEDPAYLHLTSNNTIEGTEIFDFPITGVPLICDMSSDIFSREINVADFDLIYAGAQKNMGPAGMTLVIAKNAFLDSTPRAVPSMSDYRVFRDNQSMYNTPPVFSIFVSMLNLMWLKDRGGVEEMEKLNIEKADLLYQEIDRNPLFIGTARRSCRSRMNVTFKATDALTEEKFLKFTTDRGIVGLKGYRTVGGFRASLYNALPISSVEYLVKVMQEFAGLKKEMKSNLNSI